MVPSQNPMVPEGEGADFLLGGGAWVWARTTMTSAV